MANTTTDFNKGNHKLLRDLPRILPTVTSPDAMWGITSVGISLTLFLIPMAISFWAMQNSLEGGKIVLPTSIISWVFFILAIMCMIAAFVITIFLSRMMIRWYLKSANSKDMSQEFAELKNALIAKMDELSDKNNKQQDIWQERLLSEIRKIGENKNGDTRH